MNVFDEFSSGLKDSGVAGLQAGLIGRDMEFAGPFGRQQMLYADFIASGRPLQQVEDFVTRHVLPFYANSHTEDSYCGQQITLMRELGRSEIARIVGAGPDSHVVFAGSGATAGLNRIVGLLDIARRVQSGQRIVVLLGPYEHHSNDLPWRESGAEILQVPEAPGGGLDLDALGRILGNNAGADEIIGSFSAASNVTGIITEPDPVVRILKAHGALSVWDYAGGAPYLPIEMDGAHEAPKDAIVFSPHKFPGGPAASGVMVVRDSIVKRTTPTAPGGGTVTFVSPWRHAYLGDVTAREEAGTPNVIGDIRAALAMLVKESVGVDWIAARDEALRTQLLDSWRDVPGIELLGHASNVPALPFFSFQVRSRDGGLVNSQLATRILSDHFGIQARGGCACAGPYGHRLLGIDHAQSDSLYCDITAGDNSKKPGWVRLNLSYLHNNGEAERIISGVKAAVANIDALSALYESTGTHGEYRAVPERRISA